MAESVPVGTIEKTGVVEVVDRVLDGITIVELEVGMITTTEDELELDSVLAEGVCTDDCVVSEARVVEADGVVSGVEAGVEGADVSDDTIEELDPGVVALLELPDAEGRGVVGVVGTAVESLGVALVSTDEVATGVDAEPGGLVKDERSEVKSTVVGVLSGIIGVVGIETRGVEPSREDRIDSTPVRVEDAAGVTGLEALDGVGVASEALAVKGMLGRGVRIDVRSLPALETRLVTPESSELRSLVSGRGISRPLLLVAAAGVVGAGVVTADPAGDSLPLDSDSAESVGVGVSSPADEVIGGIAVPVPTKEELLPTMGVRTDSTEVKAEPTGVKTDSTGVRTDSTGVATDSTIDDRPVAAEPRADVTPVTADPAAEVTPDTTEVTPDTRPPRRSDVEVSVEDGASVVLLLLSMMVDRPTMIPVPVDGVAIGVAGPSVELVGCTTGTETPPVPVAPVSVAVESAVEVAADSSVVEAVVGLRTGLRTPPVPRALVTGLRIPLEPRALVTGLKIPLDPRALLTGVRIGPRRPPVLDAVDSVVVGCSSLAAELVGWTTGIETPPVPVPAALDSAVGVVAAADEAADSSLEAEVVGVRMGLRTPPVPRRLVTGDTMGSRRPELLVEASSLTVELVG